MTINDIMLRDIAEAERKDAKERAEAEKRKAKRGEKIVAWAESSFVALAVFIILFLITCTISDTLHSCRLFGNRGISAERGCDPSK